MFNDLYWILLSVTFEKDVWWYKYSPETWHSTHTRNLALILTIRSTMLALIFLTLNLYYKSGTHTCHQRHCTTTGTHTTSLCSTSCVRVIVLYLILLSDFNFILHTFNLFLFYAGNWSSLIGCTWQLHWKISHSK